MMVVSYHFGNDTFLESRGLENLRRKMKSPKNMHKSVYVCVELPTSIKLELN